MCVCVYMYMCALVDVGEHCEAVYMSRVIVVASMKVLLSK